MTIFNPTVVGFVNVMVKRPSISGTYVSGIYQDSVPTSFMIKANIQPAASEDLMRLPELERTKDPIMVYTATQLNAGSHVLKQSPDVITWNGNDYEVYSLATYSMGVLDHTEALCLRVTS